MKGVSKIWHVLWDIFSPQLCVECGTVTLHEEYGLCPQCREASQPFENKEELFLADYGDRELYFDSLHSIFLYSYEIQKLIIALKEKDEFILTSYFASRAILSHRELCTSADYITSVPLSPRSLQRRGYNQSELFARSLAKVAKVPCKELLKSAGSRSIQKTLHYADRFFNSLGSFRAGTSESLAGKTVILVDDVFTTGATMNECARILKKMGAKYVFSLTIARVAVAY